MSDETDQAPTPIAGDPISARRLIRSLKSETDEQRTLFEKIADFLTSTFGTMPFLIINLT